MAASQPAARERRGLGITRPARGGKESAASGSPDWQWQCDLNRKSGALLLALSSSRVAALTVVDSADFCLLRKSCWGCRDALRR
jgi:hypothetical protein